MVQQAQRLVQLGLRDAGYVYFNIDGVQDALTPCIRFNTHRRLGLSLPRPYRPHRRRPHPLPFRHQGPRGSRPRPRFVIWWHANHTQPIHRPQVWHLQQRGHPHLPRLLPRKPPLRAPGRRGLCRVGRGLPQVRQLLCRARRRRRAPLFCHAGRPQRDWAPHAVRDVRVGRCQPVALGAVGRQQLADVCRCGQQLGRHAAGPGRQRGTRTVWRAGYVVLCATCNHLQPLAATCNHLLPLLATTYCHLQPLLAATCNHCLLPCATTYCHLQPLAATACCHVQPLAPLVQVPLTTPTCSKSATGACVCVRSVPTLPCGPPSSHPCSSAQT